MFQQRQSHVCMNIYRYIFTEKRNMDMLCSKQLWAHALCINEGENDIVGIWCCRNCRKLPETTEMLCNKIDDLQRDMAVLLKFVHSFRHTVPTVTVLDNDLSDDRSDSHDQTISLIGTPPTSIVMPTNNPVVA